MTYSIHSKLGALAKNLKENGYPVYEEEMDLRRAMEQHDVVLIDLECVSREDAFDVYTSKTLLKMEEIVRDKTWPLVHYGYFEIIPGGEDGALSETSMYIAQENPVLLSHYDIEDFSSSIAKRGAVEVREGSTLLVFAHTKNEYFGFKAWLSGNIEYGDYFMARAQGLSKEEQGN